MEVLQSTDKEKLMAEFFQKNDNKEYQEISQDAKDLVKNVVEAHEILMITNTVQCKSCYNDATLRHTKCKCGLISWSE